MQVRFAVYIKNPSCARQIRAINLDSERKNLIRKKQKRHLGIVLLCFEPLKPSHPLRVSVGPVSFYL